MYLSSPSSYFPQLKRGQQTNKTSVTRSLSLSLSQRMSRFLSPSLNPTLSLHSKPYHTPLTTFPISKPSLNPPSISRPHFRVIFSSGNPNNDLEETWWLREESRWLREEQRWLREEQRWARERESLLNEIAQLRLRIQALESQLSMQGGNKTFDETIASVVGLLQVLKEKELIAESGSSAGPMTLEEKQVVVEEKEEEDRVVRVSGEEREKKETAKSERKSMKTLRMGAEGEEVRAMQERLAKLGFYSGEDDMEYSSFDSGTERAVKTWQASVGAREDGIMTAELLEILYFVQPYDASSEMGSDKREETNGTAVASVTDMSMIQQTSIKKSEGDLEVSNHRVFLLGENRWEDPARLMGKTTQSFSPSDKTTQCLTCRGEGRLMCTECDGSGEPNIEPQFLEWVDGGANCPYCEGLGYIICDVCDGKKVVST